MRGTPLFVSCVLILVLAFTSADPAAAQFGKLKNKLKDKVERKVDQKTDQTIDKALEGGGDQEQAPAAEEPAATEPGADGTPGAAAAPAAGGTATAEDMTLYTKYDFVPGDKVLFYDDLAREELAEFPSRWNLDRGVFEIAKAEGRNWILCSDKGVIRPKIAPGPLPDKYTVEMDFYSAAHHDGWYAIHWLDSEGERIGGLKIGYSSMTSLYILDKDLSGKDHTLSILC